MLVDQAGFATSDGGSLGRDEVCQGDDFDGVVGATVSFAGVVELRPGSSEAFVTILILGQRPSQGVSSVGDGSTDPALLEAEGRQRRVGFLVLCQGRGHPAVVGVAQDEAFLGAGFRGFSQRFLEVHLNG